jgi:hypothetical protein
LRKQGSLDQLETDPSAKVIVLSGAGGPKDSANLVKTNAPIT